VPDRRKHRGPHPEDLRLFAPEVVPVLRQAVNDLAWLLSRGYAQASALKLVGDRYNLVARQRTAVARSTCSDAQASRRERHRVPADAVRGRRLWIDGYNLLTTIEAALAGGVVLAGRDGCYRDMASMHGSYRKVEETRPALELIARTCLRLGPEACAWYLDRPVSNSGRLKGIIQALAAEGGWPWRVELVDDPDPLLIAPPKRGTAFSEPPIVVTADSVVLDQCEAWLNLAREIVDAAVAGARLVDLGGI